MKRASRTLPVLLLFSGLLATMQAPAATLPDGQKSGATPQTSGALVTMAFPGVIGVNVAHNFVIDFNSGTKCWGSSSTQGTFPQAASGTTTYTFAVVTTATDPATTAVACTGSGSQSDVATVQVFSTFAAATGHLQVGIADGGQGGSATKFSDLIADVFSASRLKLDTSDSCGGGTVDHGHALLAAGAMSDYVTVIPATGWSDCKQKLSLTLASSTAVAAGTATGTLTFTMVHP
jgi:hypothetical protein